MANTDSFGQTKPTFVEDPLAPGQPLRDPAADALGQTGHRKNQIDAAEQLVVAGVGVGLTVALPELASEVMSVKAYVAASGAAAAKELLEEGVDYSIGELVQADPQLVALGDQQALATPASGVDSFGQSKPTFVDTQPTGNALSVNYKHQTFFNVTQLTMLTDQSLNNLVITYSGYTQKAHGELP